jgi:hypothetical protein
MITIKVLSTAAMMALVLPLVTPSASFAQARPQGRAGGVHAGVGHAGGGGGGARFSGARQFSGGGAARAGGGAAGPRFSGGGGGGYHGGYRRGGGGGFIPGAVAGAVIGGALAAGSYGYGGPGYYAPGYYDDQYYDQGPVAVVPDAGGGDDAVAYCMQTYRSYDPQSGTYLGNDGYRHPCP